MTAATVVWTDSAVSSGTQTFGSGAVPIDLLTVPAGLVPPPSPDTSGQQGADSMLVSAFVGIDSAGNANAFAPFQWVYVTSGGTEITIQGNTVSPKNFAAQTTAGLFENGYMTTSRLTPTPSVPLSAGGRLRAILPANFVVTYPFTLVAVAALFTFPGKLAASSLSSQVKSRADPESGSISNPVVGPFANFGYVAVGSDIVAAPPGSGSAATPDFTGVAGWQNIVTLANSNYWAGIGFASPGQVEPLAYNFIHSTKLQHGTQIWPIRAQPFGGGFSFAQVVG